MVHFKKIGVLIATSPFKAVHCESLDVLSAETFVKKEMLANGLVLNRQVSSVTLICVCVFFVTK